MFGILLLGLSATLMTIAIFQRMERPLLAAVTAYAGTVIYIVEIEPWLLPAALLVALLMGVVAVARFFLARPRLEDCRNDAAFFPDSG